ncbi:V-set and transmembrane domain-containing protein 2B-like isoform X2 [Petromyzon marinus]|uniref:V-set and transmembrane domain-containing protein 2B-like isoform X2 n=1 Tax=Petromyzon marinus TaxID=7757 RepID=A0AAJ7WJZ9_PETMA|nr:V-set and transmembrane domain-containing protein 2B-like isoform X2 [Petromyzon marinus]XP_032800584.1 V-set and transmembrane domain-containing protein 2B-like isoform X2 [Petromyzon marinus]XP_032800585.1 V-set and transmembrane domain-containing protein 2B-like isoform X2 [Petromyzon marinus]
MEISVRPVMFAALHLVACANAYFTTLPRDVTASEGHDVFMTCEYRARAAASGGSIEMQWWHLRDAAGPAGGPGGGGGGGPPPRGAHTPTRLQATKISTVRVLGRDINNTLQLAHVTPRDAGLYECRVSDRSGVRAQEHKARATLHVGSRSQPRRDSQVPEARPLTKGAPPRAAAAPPTWNATTTAAATAAAATTRPSSVPRNDGDRRGRSQPAPTAAHGQQRRRQSGSGCPDPPLPWGILGLLLPLVW